MVNGDYSGGGEPASVSDAKTLITSAASRSLLRLIDSAAASTPSNNVERSPPAVAGSLKPKSESGVTANIRQILTRVAKSGSRFPAT